MKIFPFTQAQRELIDRVQQVAAGFAARAADYDERACMPEEDIRDLHREGWLLATLEKKYGGLGFGLEQDDPLSFFLIIEHIAMVNPSTAHCFQVHNNCVQIINHFGTEEQILRFVEPTRERGKLLPVAGTEPTTHFISDGMRTLLRPEADHFVLNGIKHYVTDGPAGEYLWVMAKDEPTGKEIQLAIPMDTPGVVVDDRFWDPIGMRACVSPIIEFQDVKVPPEAVIGRPGAYFAEGWLSKINIGFTATYVGTMRGIHDYVLEYLKDKGRAADPQRQQYMGEIKTRIDAIRLLFYTGVTNIREDEHGGMLMVEEAKWLAVESAKVLPYLVGQAGGSTLLMKKHPVERMLRDLQMHALHGRHFLTADVVGKAQLGQPYYIGLSVG